MGFGAGMVGLAIANRLAELGHREFGWIHILDLGDITTARAAEMDLPIWLRMWGTLGTGMFNVKVMK